MVWGVYDVYAMFSRMLHRLFALHERPQDILMVTLGI